MNCPHAENLLPLYVEGDLTAERARDLAHHLRSCGACARLAREYDESQERLRLYAPPEFAEDFFQGIRQAVMTEIERKQSAPPAVIPFPLLSRFGRTTLALAASLALLLASGALALHLLRQRTLTQYALPSVASLNPPTSQPAAVSSRGSDTNEGRSAGNETAQNDARERLNLTPPSRGRRVARRTARAVALPDQSAQARFAPILPASFAEAQESGNNAPQDDATERPMLRMEIQTSDPSIRIIWFAPRSTE